MSVLWYDSQVNAEAGKVSVLVADVIHGLGLQEALHSCGLVTAGLAGTPELAILPGKTGEVWMETLEALPTRACNGSALYPTSRSLSGTVCPSWAWEWLLVHNKELQCILWDVSRFSSHRTSTSSALQKGWADNGCLSAACLFWYTEAEELNCANAPMPPRC